MLYDNLFISEEDAIEQLEEMVSLWKYAGTPQRVTYPWIWVYVWWMRDMKREWFWIMKRFRDKSYTWELVLYEWAWSNDMPNWFWKQIAYDWVIVEWEFKNWEMNWFWHFLDPQWGILEWNFVNYSLTWKWKRFLWDWTLVYEGDFINRQYEWQWRQYLENGDIYEWFFKNSVFDGSWKYTVKETWKIIEGMRSNWKLIQIYS